MIVKISDYDKAYFDTFDRFVGDGEYSLLWEARVYCAVHSGEFDNPEDAAYDVYMVNDIFGGKRITLLEGKVALETLETIATRVYNNMIFGW